MFALNHNKHNCFKRNYPKGSTMKIDRSTTFCTGKVSQVRKPISKHSAGGKQGVTKMTERVLQRLALADIMLQATTKRRRYMRRGSKTPAMLMLSARLDDYSSPPTLNPAEQSCPEQGQPIHHSRKASAMSLLSLQLKRSDLFASSPTPVMPMRPKMVERKRSLPKKE